MEWTHKIWRRHVFANAWSTWHLFGCTPRLLYFPANDLFWRDRTWVYMWLHLHNDFNKQSNPNQIECKTTLPIQFIFVWTRGACVRVSKGEYFRRLSDARWWCRWHFFHFHFDASTFSFIFVLHYQVLSSLTFNFFEFFPKHRLTPHFTNYSCSFLLTFEEWLLWMDRFQKFVIHIELHSSHLYKCHYRHRNELN